MFWIFKLMKRDSQDHFWNQNSDVNLFDARSGVEPDTTSLIQHKIKFYSFQMQVSHPTPISAMSLMFQEYQIDSLGDWSPIQSTAIVLN